MLQLYVLKTEQERNKPQLQLSAEGYAGSGLDLKAAWNA